MLGLDEIVLAKSLNAFLAKCEEKFRGAHLQLIPSLLDLRDDESGVERLAQAAVKDTIAILKSENKTLSQPRGCPG